MSAARRQMHLGVFVLGTGNHSAGWRYDGAFTSSSSLPVMQAIALLFPPTYAFEAARSALSTPEVRWEWVAIASLENVIYFALSVWFFLYMFRRSRETGQFARNEE